MLATEAIITVNILFILIQNDVYGLFWNYHLFNLLNIDHEYPHLFRAGHEAKCKDGEEHLQGAKDDKRTHEATWGGNNPI